MIVILIIVWISLKFNSVLIVLKNPNTVLKGNKNIRKQEIFVSKKTAKRKQDNFFRSVPGAAILSSVDDGFPQQAHLSGKLMTTNAACELTTAALATANTICQCSQEEKNNFGEEINHRDFETQGCHRLSQMFQNISPDS